MGVGKPTPAPGASTLAIGLEIDRFEDREDLDAGHEVERSGRLVAEECWVLTVTAGHIVPRSTENAPLIRPSRVGLPARPEGSRAGGTEVVPSGASRAVWHGPPGGFQ